MINLTRFIKPIVRLAPLWDGWGQVDGRKIYKPTVENSWYWFDLGVTAEIQRKATLLEIDTLLRSQKFLRVYAFGSEGIPLNFDNFLKKGLAETILVNSLNLPPFQLAKIVQWEDGRFYFHEADTRSQRETLRRVKEAFDADQPITDLKRISPELRYYYLLLSLQKQSFRHLEALEQMKLSEAEKKKRLEEFKDTFAGRLQQVIEQAGGKLVKFIKHRGSSYMVHWKINGELVKSQITDDLRIVSAGFCLSGDDTSHTMGSIVNLAKLFQEDAPLYITYE
jgi:hypothetical protein